MGFGIAPPDAPLSLQSCEEKTIPAGAWFRQFFITGDTARKVIGNKKTLNGIRIDRPVVMVKSADDDWNADGEIVTLADEEEIDADELMIEIAEILKASLTVDDLEKIDLEALAKSIIEILEADAEVQVDMMEVLAKAINEVVDPDSVELDISPEELGELIAAGVMANFELIEN